MTKPKTSQEIDDAAAGWAALVDRGPLSAEDERALEAWVSLDARHLGAYAKARAVAVRTERARALGPHFDSRKFAKIEDEPPTTRRAMLLGGAALAAAGVALVIGVESRRTAPTVEVPLAENRLESPKSDANPSIRTFSTRLGETRIVPLEDGSIVTLNTASAIAINYTEQRRDARLLAGEALFDVAKDRARPFVVSARDTEVRAVGTSFTVQILPERPVSVLVKEGIVEVNRPQVPTAPTVRVSANNRVVAPADAPIVTKPVAAQEVNRELVWRVGRLSFEGESLGQAVATFSRYSETRIVIDDPTLANATITGLFVSNDPIGFAKAVAISLNLRADVGEREVRLSR